MRETPPADTFQLEHPTYISGYLDALWAKAQLEQWTRLRWSDETLLRCRRHVRSDAMRRRFLAQARQMEAGLVPSS